MHALTRVAYFTYPYPESITEEDARKANWEQINQPDVFYALLSTKSAARENREETALWQCATCLNKFKTTNALYTHTFGRIKGGAPKTERCFKQIPEDPAAARACVDAVAPLGVRLYNCLFGGKTCTGRTGNSSTCQLCTNRSGLRNEAKEQHMTRTLARRKVVNMDKKPRYTRRTPASAAQPQPQPPPQAGGQPPAGAEAPPAGPG